MVGVICKVCGEWFVVNDEMMCGLSKRVDKSSRMASGGAGVVTYL